MRAILSGALRFWDMLEDIAACLAGAAMLSAMVLVTVDAILRHVFAQPLTFQQTLTEKYLLVALVLFALPWGVRTGGYIRIDELTRRLPMVLSEVVLRAGLVASSIFVFLLARAAYFRFLDAYLRDEVVLGVIDWPVAWSWFPLPVGLGMLAVRLLIEATLPQTGTEAHSPRASAEP